MWRDDDPSTFEDLVSVQEKKPCMSQNFWLKKAVTAPQTCARLLSDMSYKARARQASRHTLGMRHRDRTKCLNRGLTVCLSFGHRWRLDHYHSTNNLLIFRSLDAQKIGMLRCKLPKLSHQNFSWETEGKTKREAFALVLKNLPFALIDHIIWSCNHRFLPQSSVERGRLVMFAANTEGEPAKLTHFLN